MREHASALILLVLTAGTIFAQQPFDNFDSTKLPLVQRVPDVDADNSGMSLTDLQSIALANNPTLRLAQAQVEAEQGAAFQAGLRPNPHVGYVAEQIGVNGTAGELQGGFVSQEFVRGNKLGLSRAKYSQRVQIAMTNPQAQQQREFSKPSQLRVPGYPQNMLGMEPMAMGDMKMPGMGMSEMKPSSPYAMDMSWKSMIEGRREAAGMRTGWSIGVEELSKVVRVLSPELYDKLTNTDDVIEPNTSTPWGPGDAKPMHHDYLNHGEIKIDDMRMPNQK